MKKTISLAVVTMFLFSASVVAQPPRGPQGPQGPAPEKCDKCDSCDSCKCAMTIVVAKPEMPNPFAGIDLTKEQQEKIEALRKNCVKPEGEAPKAPEACPENDPRKQQLESIKEILTPDQYVTYLENMLLGQQAPMQKKGKGRLKGMPHGHGPQINPPANQENDK